MSETDSRDLTTCTDPPPADVPAIMAEVTAALQEFFRRGFGEVRITVHDGGVTVDTTMRRRWKRGTRPPDRKG
jgi:hypothetical protein